MEGFPLPGQGDAVVAVPAPGAGEGQWAGAPSAVQDVDGSFVVGYRVRNGHDGNDQTVVARSPDGERFTVVATLDESYFGAMAVERPALVRKADGRWRMYVCCATPGSKHWWIGAMDADAPEGFDGASVRRAFPGTDEVGVKDPVVRVDPAGRWHAWICCHLLDQPGAEDRMNTAYATSDDGIEWHWHGTVLEGRPGKWDARGARVTTVLADRRAAYDARATAAENWFERTGLALIGEHGEIVPAGEEPVADVRYLDVVPLAGGGHRIYYEARLPDESHELRTELFAP